MSFTTGNDINILQGTDASTVSAGAGNDRYVLDASTLSANQKITITDTLGSNTLQLAGGLVIVSAAVAANDMQLTLSNGAVITLLGASSFSFQTGGNVLSGTGGTVETYAQFVTSSLGIAAGVPAVGATPVVSGSVTVNPAGGTGAVVVPPGAATYTLASDVDTVVEGSDVTFTVTRTGDLTAAKSLSFNTTGDTNGATVNAATPGTDTSPASGTATFAAGAATATFTVSATADAMVEGLEGLKVSLFDGITVAASKVILISDDPVAPAQPFTLTTGTDSGPAFVGDGADNTFNAALDLGIGGLLGVQTLQGTDVIDGDAGFDVLNATLNGTGASVSPKISNIEQYNLTSVQDNFGTGELDLGNASGYQQLWNRNSRVDLALTTVGEVAVLGMDNVRDASTYSVQYDNIAVGTQVAVVNKSGTVGSPVVLDIIGNQGAIGTLNLNVSNGAHLDLQNGASDVENLVIAGSGALELTGANEFQNLQTLDTMGYVGNVKLDVSGSGDLVSVMTAAGDDQITVGAASVNGGLAVDLGAGANVLGVFGAVTQAEINLLNFTGGVENVQTLEMVDNILLAAAATLNLDGFDAALGTVAFSSFDGATFGLNILAAPETLEITSDQFDMNLGLLTVEGVVDLTMTSTVNDVRVSGGLNSTTLETLVISGADDARLLVNGGADALTSIDVDALGDDGRVDLVLASASELGALTTVKVTAADDATLNMTGTAGIAFVAGIKQVESFVVDVGNAGNQTGNIVFTSGDLAAGFIATNYAENGPFSRDNGAARDIAADLNASVDLNATSPNLGGFPTGNTVTVEWATFGAKQQLSVLSAVAGTGTLSTPALGNITVVTPGADQIAMVAGKGFEAVETLTVNGGDDAIVSLIDVYGSFTLDVTAADDANVSLLNTLAKSVTVSSGMAAGGTATVVVGGDTVGAQDLTKLVVTGDMANVTLSKDLASFTTLDVSGVKTDVVVDSSLAKFVVTPGNYVAYLIGATTDGNNATVDVSFTGNTEREVYDFVGANIGNVEINNFTWGADPAIGDRLDLSGFVSSQGQLVFTDVGADLVITDLAGGLVDFAGSITIVGGAGQDLSFNIIYA